jgi:hypothetical protein
LNQQSREWAKAFNNDNLSDHYDFFIGHISHSPTWKKIVSEFGDLILSVPEEIKQDVYDKIR